jgi:hypothetical protein
MEKGPTYAVSFAAAPMGLVLEGRGASLTVTHIDGTSTADTGRVVVGDTVTGVNGVAFGPLTSHSARVSQIGVASWPRTLHFRRGGVGESPMPSTPSFPVSSPSLHTEAGPRRASHWKKALSQVTAVVRMRRPVSRARIGESPIYQGGLTVQDHEGINDWFKETKAINNRRKKEHRKLYVGKRTLVRGSGAWQRPGMPYLCPIRSQLLKKTTDERMKRHAARKQRNHRRLTDAIYREEQLEKHRQLDPLFPNYGDGGGSIERADLSLEQLQFQAVHHYQSVPLALSPIPSRDIVWPEGSQEDFTRILSRGVRFHIKTEKNGARTTGALFILSAERIQLMEREIGLRFIAFDIRSCRRTVLRVPWSQLTAQLRDFGRASLAERCVNCISFPSPGFERKARIFAVAAFFIHRVTIVPASTVPGSAQGDGEQHSPATDDTTGSSLNEFELVLVETRTWTSNDYSEDNHTFPTGESNDADEHPRNVYAANAPTSPLKHCIPSLPVRAGVLRTALHPEHMDWHKILSRKEMREALPWSSTSVDAMQPTPLLGHPSLKKRRARGKKKRANRLLNYDDDDDDDVEQDATGADGDRPASSPAPVQRAELLQMHLEAMDALELVARFNNSYGTPKLDSTLSELELDIELKSELGRTRPPLFVERSALDCELDGEAQPHTMFPEPLIPPREHAWIPESTPERKDGNQRSNHEEEKDEEERRAKPSSRPAIPQRPAFSSFLTELTTATAKENVPEKDDVTIAISFGAGSLGLGLGDVVKINDTSSQQARVVVISVEDHCPVKGQILIGDELVCVGGVSISGASFEDVLDRIRNGSRPLRLEFVRSEEVLTSSQNLQADSDERLSPGQSRAGLRNVKESENHKTPQQRQTSRKKTKEMQKDKKKTKKKKKKKKNRKARRQRHRARAGSPLLTKASVTSPPPPGRWSPIPEGSLSVPSLMDSIESRSRLEMLELLGTQVFFLQSVVDNHSKLVDEEGTSDETLARSMNELAQLQVTIEKLRFVKIDSGGQKEAELALRAIDRGTHRMANEVGRLLDAIKRIRKLGKYSDVARSLLK